ncbi:alkaline phosphatase family protein [Microbispora sp. ATCC PTA-5024]|uniref:alkaline phosphatase family protein n=1 Tax=Microbispora sp. ATCC PTA-5024 TaxID=316330 RepID=UPI0003FE34FA|nr:alkaline phosphatase family protein [Microbispora sp. ATCC PTA-5024]
MRSSRVLPPAVAALALALLAAPPALANGGAGHGNGHGDTTVVGRYHHLVVIYEENHSFDNLWGGWGPVGGHRVDGLSGPFTPNAKQVAQDGTPYTCLLQNDVNLTSPPLSSTCQDTAHGVPASHFANRPFTIDDYIAPTDKTCPAPGVFAPNGVPKDSAGAEPGGCTRDLVHRFYQEQYQIDHGRQDRYVTGGDAAGLTMGVYDTRKLPLWTYLHGPGAPRYVIADRFFQGAFGGSFLNHQYLIAARAPVDTAAGPGGAQESLHSVVDADGFPNAGYPLYKPATTVKDAQLTQACGAAANPDVACGDYAVNTIQPASAPFGSGPQLPLIDDAKYPNIGDRLSDAGIDWAWYSGGWNDAAGGHPGPLFQYHHQPFNYFAAYAPGQPGRAHLKDETEFVAAARQGTLPAVSFVKPYGAENEHPGYASEAEGSDHLVDLITTIENGPQAKDTLVVVTYDEFGGQWDHVPPPGRGSPTWGVHDQFGPGTRIPAIVLSRSLPHSGVDHTVYDTTSILATIERGLHLAPVATRDARVNDLSAALRAAGA